MNENWLVIDRNLRNYREKVDTTTYDATNKVYTTVEYLRPENDSRYLRAVLSNKVGGNYTTDTWNLYDDSGTTVIDTVIWTLTYDANGIVTDKVPNK